MQWARSHLMVGTDYQVMPMFWMDQVQKVINHFKTLSTFKKDSLDKYDQIKPHPFIETVLLNYGETSVKEYLNIVARTTGNQLYYNIRDSVTPVPEPTEPILK